MDIPIVLPYALVELIPYVACGGAAYLGWRFGLAHERRPAEGEQLRGLSGRLRALEQSVAELGELVIETSEARRFSTDLLSKRDSVGPKHLSARDVT
jgi:hypothetical protein